METTAKTRYGSVRGGATDGVIRFLGIPYAASPTGPLRFAAPAPPPPWDGTRDCLAFGATPPKPDYVAPFDTLLPEPSVPGDDWLTVNVWTTGLTGRRPVMVWIYGGAFANGNSAVGMYDGHAFARDGAVLVTFNYRLGVDGFALLPDAPANRGLLDQVAALEWVRDNIAAFGGDPGNVTIFGESAGAMSVITLLTMPRGRGLFTRAIAQSGAAQAAAEAPDARLVTAELGKTLGLEATAASLADIGLPELIKAQFAVQSAMDATRDQARFGPTVVASSMAFIPVVDGDVVPRHPLESLRAGAGRDVPLLTGTNAEEFRLFLVPTGMAAMVTDEALPGVLGAMGIGQEVAAVYRANRPDASAGDLLCALLTDRFFRLPALAVAQARAAGPAATYMYEFAWRSPVMGIGAAHAVEIPFVFGNVHAPDAETAIGSAAPAGLAREMHETWIRFAATGDPGWPPFGPGHPVMTWDGQAATLALDPRADERLSWERA